MHNLHETCNPGRGARGLQRDQGAIGDREARLGLYRYYCERRLPTSPAVEHVAPKSLKPARETDWSNFLPGCGNCNSVRFPQPTNDTDFLWPDKNNTLRAFFHEAGGFAKPSPGLPLDFIRKTQQPGWDKK
ncbi:MAG: hypothetical protein H7A45_18095 [Verrucomicrobiales bacterium]|nr:hypothetical protein [Verrucomicrobiales bacterium]MCP5525474.1 hypothetical protein [Verrucomicrobiales bacterium]